MTDNNKTTETAAPDQMGVAVITNDEGEALVLVAGYDASIRAEVKYDEDLDLVITALTRRKRNGMVEACWFLQRDTDYTVHEIWNKFASKPNWYKEGGFLDQYTRAMAVVMGRDLQIQFGEFLKEYEDGFEADTDENAPKKS